MSNDTQTLTLTDFLLARIAEDEAVARSSPDVERKSDAAVFTSLSEPTGTVEFDPARVLAECEARRLIVRTCTAELAGRDVQGAQMDGDDGPWLAEQTLRALASVYADHSNYREEWR